MLWALEAQRETEAAGDVNYPANAYRIEIFYMGLITSNILMATTIHPASHEAPITGPSYRIVIVR